MLDIFESTLILNDGTKDYSGLINLTNWPSNSDAYLEYEIEPKNEFRPDKIAFDFYSEESLSWVIDEVNNFFSLQEYTKLKKIKILKQELLQSLQIG